VTALASLVVAVSALGMWLRRTNLSDRYFWVGSGGPTDDKPARMRSWDAKFFGGYVRFERAAQDIPDPANEFWKLSLNNRFKHEVEPPFAARPLTWPLSGATSRIYVDGHGFGLATSSRAVAGYQYRAVVVQVPLWLIMILFAIAPAIWEIRYRRWILQRFRTRGGLCANCGYDLRATPHRCPECGAAT
jgi:hypothetical protein